MKPPARAATYAVIYQNLCAIAQSHGYALAVHGSMARDLDLVAIPWTDEAVDALTLIRAFKAATGTVTHTAEADHFFPDCHPTAKPHGRMAYSIHCTDQGGQGPYLDVSVLPRRVTEITAP